MSKPVFRDTKLQNEFDKKGYVTISFLNESDIVYLKDKFFETINESGGPKIGPNVDFQKQSEINYDFTFIDNNVEYKQKVFDIITERFTKKANEYLLDYKPIIANYIRKKQDGGEVPMHQNWAFVDEEKYTSVSVWVPLVDSNEENGTLQMVDGSHKRFGQYRGPMVPWELRNLKEEIVSKHLTPMNVKAGQAVILDDSIVHYSNINKTPGLRLAIQLIMIPSEASSIHYHYDKETDAKNIHVLETNVDFYTHFHPWLKPKGLKELKTIPYKEKTYSYSDFIAGLNSQAFDTLLNYDLCKSKNSPLFNDSKLQTQFETDGYVKIPLLNENEVRDLKEFYLSLKHEHIGSYGFHVSLDSRDENYIKTIFNKLFTVLKPKLNPLLQNYKAFTASYVIKEAGLQNIVPPHQDWSFVDESEFCSATVWVPLMNVNKTNGALGVIKGSHLLFNTPRNSPSPQSRSLLADHLFTLFPYVEVIEMKAGEALIFNNKLIHASPPNTSDKARIGVGIGITQANAQLLHYYEVPNSNIIEVYKVDEGFFEKYNNVKLGDLFNNGLKPTELQLHKTILKHTPEYSKDEVISMIKEKTGASLNSELMKELADLYNYNLDGTPKAQPNKQVKKTEETEITTIENTQPVWKDERTFLQKYTPSNILAEIKYRLTKQN